MTVLVGFRRSYADASPTEPDTSLAERGWTDHVRIGNAVAVEVPEAQFTGVERVLKGVPGEWPLYELKD